MSEKRLNINDDKSIIEKSGTKDIYKKETQKQLNIAETILNKTKNKPELYKKFLIAYTKLRKIISNSIKYDNEITSDELQNIKNEVTIIQWKQINLSKKQYTKNLILKNLQENNKFKEKDIPFYLENINILSLIDDESFLLKMINYSKKNKHHTNALTIKNLNPIFRNNINIIKKLPTNLTFEDLILIDTKLLKNSNSVAEILNKTQEIKTTFLILLDVHWSKNIIDFLTLVLKTWILKNDLIKNLSIYLPLSITKLDKKNKLNFNEEELKKINNFFEKDFCKLKKIKENILYMFSLKETEINHTKIGDINLYIQEFWISWIKNEMKQIINKWYLKYFILDYILADKELAILAIQKNKKNIIHIPSKIKWESNFIKEFLKFKTKQDKTDIITYINAIEFNNMDAIIIFYEWAKEQNNEVKILLNNNFRVSLRRILKQKDEISEKDEDIFNHISNIIGDINSIKNSLIFIKNNTINKIEKEEINQLLLKEIWEDKANKIMKMFNIEGNLSTETYSQILDACNNDNDKVKNIIDKILKIQLKNLEKKFNTTSKIKDTQYINKKLNEIISDWVIIPQKIEENFIEFLCSNKIKNNEKTEEYKEKIVRKYLETLELWQEDEKIIKNILFLALKKNKIKKNVENIDIYVEYLSWKITKEEYEKQAINSIYKNSKQNNKKIKDLNNHIIPEEYYSDNEMGWYNITTENWKTITISKQEKEITQNNPKILKNLINFHNFFEDLNLKSVWKYRKDIIDAMRDVNIDIKDDSLNKEELLKFWKKIIKFINNIPKEKNLNQKEKLLIPNNFWWIKNELKKYSWAKSILSNKKTYWIHWNGRFDYDLRRLWIIWNSLGFQKETFSKIMKWEKI